MTYLAKTQGITWAASKEPPIAVEPRNLEFDPHGGYPAWHASIPISKVMNTCVLGRKRRSGGRDVTIYDQVNLATDWLGYAALKTLIRRQVAPLEMAGGRGAGAKYVAVANAGFRGIHAKGLYDRLKSEPAPVRIAVIELIEVAASQIAVPGMAAALQAYTSAFEKKSRADDLVNTANFSDELTTGVKEWLFVWRKTSVHNILTAVLRPMGTALPPETVTKINEYIAAALPEMRKAVATTYNPLAADNPGKLLPTLAPKLVTDAGVLLDKYPATVDTLLTSIRTDPVSFPHVKVEFQDHRADLIGPRQDTYIAMDSVAAATPIWPGKDLFVIELRGGQPVLDLIAAIIRELGGTPQASMARALRAASTARLASTARASASFNVRLAGACAAAVMFPMSRASSPQAGDAFIQRIYYAGYYAAMTSAAEYHGESALHRECGHDKRRAGFVSERDRPAGDGAERRAEHHVAEIVLTLPQSRGAHVGADGICRDASLPSEALTNDAGRGEHRRCVSRRKRVVAAVRSFAPDCVFESLCNHAVQQLCFDQIDAGGRQP